MWLASEYVPIWQATEAWLEAQNVDPPYWAFCWPGGQAVARFLLDNPAVVVLGEARSDAELQAMAAEFNLSESAFLTQLGEGHYGLRWFTPQVEVDLCGHGTLAAAHVLWQTGAVSGDLPIRFATRSGELVARREGEWIWLDFPRIATAPLVLDPAYAAAVGCQPLQTLAAGAKFLLELASEEAVRALTPDFHALRALPGRGIMVTAPPVRRTTITVLPCRLPSSTQVAVTQGAVLSVTITSRSGILCTGEKKCRPMNRCGAALACASPAIGSVEVFDANTPPVHWLTSAT